MQRVSPLKADRLDGTPQRVLEEWRRSLQAQDSREAARNYAILQVLLQTGIRLGECSALTFGDVTLGERSGSLVIRAGKGNKMRTIPLNASAREALAAYVGLRLEVEQATV